MFFQENGNVKKEETKIKKLGIIMVLFMIFFIFTKVKILPVNIGVVSIIILYIFINFNMTNIYFSSKRTLANQQQFINKATLFISPFLTLIILIISLKTL